MGETADTDRGGDGVDESLILDLNFVPQWARKPPGGVSYEERPGREERPRRGGRGRTREGRGAPRRERFDHPPRERRREAPRPRDRDRAAEPHGERRREGPPPRREPDPDRAAPQRSEHRRAGPRPGPRPELPPVVVRFVPNQGRLSAVVRKIRNTSRAYPLGDLAGLVLAAPDAYAAKLEMRRDAEESHFYQCKVCGAAALQSDALLGHFATAHFTDHFVREETTVDPPSGEFVCVARCGMSGALLGPPNHHSYNEKLQEMHRTRFPHMDIEDYRARIEMVRDEETIAQWKEEMRQKVVYRLRDGDGNGPAGEPLTWTEAAEQLRTRIAPARIIRARTVSVPAAVIERLPEPGLRAAVTLARRREAQQPRSLLFALRAAFLHMHLHVFRAGSQAEFVASVAPAPLDPGQTVDDIRSVLEFLKEHPGCKRLELLTALHPDTEPTGKEAARALASLSWLIEKGHIIEFFDGSLAVPLASSAGKRSRRRPA
jgi:hypothetical protein